MQYDEHRTKGICFRMDTRMHACTLAVVRENICTVPLPLRTRDLHPQNALAWASCVSVFLFAYVCAYTGSRSFVNAVHESSPAP